MQHRVLTRSVYPAATFLGTCAGFALSWLLAPGVAAQSLASPTLRAGVATVSGLGTRSVVINQTTDKAVFDWRSFSVGAGTSVDFRQPGTSSITLNRITGAGPTRVDGSITANGQVWLLNPNGVLIGSSGRLTAAGLVATTHAISTADFMAGTYRFDGTAATGDIVNDGAIVADGGYAVLAGNHVDNAGLVQARLGKVVLGAGKAFVIDIAGDHLLSFALTEAAAGGDASAALVNNSGRLSAAGGTVIMTARTAAAVAGGVINTTGVIDATAVHLEGGTIVLDGGDGGHVTAVGVLDASGKGAGQSGGTIAVSGAAVTVGAGARLDASGSAAGGTISVGGGWQGALINGRPSALEATVAAGAQLDASALDRGNGGTISLWSDVTSAASRTLAFGTFAARGGALGGDGGRIETSGHYLSTTGASGSAAAPLGASGVWLFDPFNVEVVAATTASSASRNGLFVTAPAGQLWVPYATPSKLDAADITALLDSGTSVQITTGNQVAGGAGAAAEAGNITVNAAITKSAGASVKLEFDAIGRIVFNKAIVSTANALNLVLNAGASGIALNSTIDTNGGTVGLNTTGAATQAGALTATALKLGGTGGTYTLTAAANAFALLSGKTASVTLADSTAVTVSRLSTTGPLTLASAGDIAVSGANSFGGPTALATLGSIVIAPGAQLAVAATLTLDAGARFSNQAGAGVITGGRWLIYSADPAADSFGGLQSGALAVWGQTSATMATATGAPGDRYVFALSPQLTVTATAAHKTYGDIIGSSNRTYSVGGLVDAGAYGAVFLQDTVSGTAQIASLGDAGPANAGSYAQTATLGSLLIPAGYRFASVSTSLTVDARQLTLSAVTDSKTYDGATASIASPVETGLVNGDTITGFAQSFDSRSAGLRRLAVDGDYAINDHNGGQNYTVTLTGAAGSIGTRLLTASLTGSVTKVYDGSTAATLAEANYTLSGAVSGDVVALNTPPAGNYADRNAGSTKAVSVSGLALTGSDAGNYTVNSTTAAAIGTISAKLLSASLIGNVVKTYDGSTAATLAAADYTLSGAVSGDAVALTTPVAGSYADRNAGSTKAVSVGGLALTGSDAANYTVNTAATGAIGTITAKTLSASLIGSVMKVYDGSTAATLAGANYLLSGTVAGDVVGLNTPPAGNYADRNAGSTKAVSVSGLALTGSDAGNYTVNSTTAAAIGTISAKALSASLIGTISKVYDGSTSATLAAGNYLLSAAVAGDAVALSTPAIGSYADRGAGAAKTVSVGGLALTGADSGNYTVNAAAAAAIGTISAKALSASLTGTISKVYDGSTSATLAAGNYLLSAAIADDAVALNSPVAASYADHNAGTTKAVSVSGLTLSGADAGNYTVNTTAAAPIGIISAKVLSASLVGNVAKLYDGSTAATLSTDNYLLSGLVAGETVEVSQTRGQYSSAGAGTGISISTTIGPDDYHAGGAMLLGNYVLPTGTIAGSIGTITPQIIVAIVTTIPVPVITAIIEPTPAAAVTSDSGAGKDNPATRPPVTTVTQDPGFASPVSPIGVVKPATPVDSADADDPILALVSPDKPDSPAKNQNRQRDAIVQLAGGLLGQESGLALHLGVDQTFSGSGTPF